MSRPNPRPVSTDEHPIPDDETIAKPTITDKLRRVVSERTPPLDAPAGDAASGAGAQDKRMALRKRLFAGLAISVGGVALLGGAYWVLIGSRYVSTDNAYVGASTVQVAPQINGDVKEVHVGETQAVKAGDILAVLDPADAKIALAQAEAEYGRAVRRVRQYYAANASAGAAVVARRADLQRAQVDYQRREALAASGAVSADELSTAKNAYLTAQANLQAAISEQAMQNALIQGVDINDNPEVQAAKAAVDAAKLNLARTVIRAPIDGIVTQATRTVIGQHVQIGQPLMLIAPVQRAFIDANFKESQLRKMHVGQRVTVTSDLYGGGVKYHGRVVGIGGGTGTAFAIIPAQNATGNWIKVVQRVPVRISLDPAELQKHPLRVGLSMSAKVNVSD